MAKATKVVTPEQIILGKTTINLELSKEEAIFIGRLLYCHCAGAGYYEKYYGIFESLDPIVGDEVKLAGPFRDKYTYRFPAIQIS